MDMPSEKMSADSDRAPCGRGFMTGQAVSPHPHLTSDLPPPGSGRRSPGLGGSSVV